jgi:hypothetical protein
LEFFSLSRSVLFLIFLPGINECWVTCARLKISERKLFPSLIDLFRIFSETFLWKGLFYKSVFRFWQQNIPIVKAYIILSQWFKYNDNWLIQVVHIGIHQFWFWNGFSYLWFWWGLNIWKFKKNLYFVVSEK